MTWLELYGLFGVPLVLLAMAFAALWLNSRDEHHTPAE